jgi:hypothetical protein
LNQISEVHRNSLFYRLIALWVVIEAFLGGIIHSFNLPISGLIVASGAFICLSLIARYCQVKGAILKATVIVALFKLMLSPQASPTAYIAVFFQGLLAQLLFTNNKYFSVKCILLCVLSLVESGMQKIIVLTLLYGVDFYKAIDEMVRKLLHTKAHYSFSIYIAATYVFIHLITGLAVGLFTTSLPNKIITWKAKYSLFTIDLNNTEEEVKKKKPRDKFIKAVLIVLFIIGLVYFTHTAFGKSKILYLLARAVSILFLWHFIIKPTATFLLNKWLHKARLKNATAIHTISNLLPTTTSIVKQSWQYAAHQSTENKLKLFAKLVIINIISNDNY